MRLHVLRQGQADRATVGRVGHDLDGARQRREQLFGAADAVKVTRDRAEAVVGGNVALLEALHLLQHRVRRARGKGIAGQQQHRQAVHVGHRGRCHHVGGARSDAGADGHHALAQMGFGKANGRVRHALFIVGTEGFQCFALFPEGFAQARHVAVAEDGENAAAIRLNAAVGHFNAQGGEVARKRLRHGQLDACHHGSRSVRLIVVIAAVGAIFTPVRRRRAACCAGCARRPRGWCSWPPRAA